jgi:hypothetical protein
MLTFADDKAEEEEEENKDKEEMDEKEKEANEPMVWQSKKWEALNDGGLCKEMQGLAAAIVPSTQSEPQGCAAFIEITSVMFELVIKALMQVNIKGGLERVKRLHKLGTW